MSMSLLSSVMFFFGVLITSIGVSLAMIYLGILIGEQLSDNEQFQKEVGGIFGITTLGALLIMISLYVM